LYEGAPSAASPSVAKTNNVCASRCLGARCGRSFGEYVRSGKRSNSCFIGAGTVKMLREGVE
jgi:hypothetical protein